MPSVSPRAAGQPGAGAGSYTRQLGAGELEAPVASLSSGQNLQEYDLACVRGGSWSQPG